MATAAYTTWLLLYLLVVIPGCCLEHVDNVYLDITPGVALRLTSSSQQPGTLNIGVSLDRQLATGRSSKMENWMMMMMPIMMMMVGMFPYMMMGVQMLVMKAYNMSNMILMGAIMMTLRNFIFTDHFGTGVVYNNLGWREKPLPHYPGHKHHSGHWHRSSSRRRRRR